MRVEFFVAGDPPRATAQERKVSTRNGRTVFYNPDSVQYAKELLTLWMRQHRPQRPMEGALRLDVHWMFRAKSQRPRTWKTTRPDVDNLMKLLCDVMTRLDYWHDDNQICDLRVRKSWQASPGIRVTIEEIGGTDAEV